MRRVDRASPADANGRHEFVFVFLLRSYHLHFMFIFLLRFYHLH